MSGLRMRRAHEPDAKAFSSLKIMSRCGRDTDLRMCVDAYPYRHCAQPSSTRASRTLSCTPASDAMLEAGAVPAVSTPTGPCCLRRTGRALGNLCLEGHPGESHDVKDAQEGECLWARNETGDSHGPTDLHWCSFVSNSRCGAAPLDCERLLRVHLLPPFLTHKCLESS